MLFHRISQSQGFDFSPVVEKSPFILYQRTGFNRKDTVLGVNHKLSSAGRELEARRRPAAGFIFPALLITRIKGSLVFKHPIDQMSEQPHGGADDNHFAFSFLGQADGQGLHSRIAAQSGDGRKVKRLAQTPMAQLAHPSPARDGTRLALAGCHASKGGQLAAALQLTDLWHDGQDGNGSDGAHAGNGGEQGNGSLEVGMLLERIFNLPVQSDELAVQQPDLSPEVFGRGGGGAFQMLPGHHTAFERLLPDAHELLELFFGGGGRLPGAGLMLLAITGDERGIVGIGFISAHPGAGEEVDGHGVDDADHQTTLVEITSHGQAVGAGGFQTNLGRCWETDQPAGQGVEAFGCVGERVSMSARGQKQDDIKLEFGDIDAKLRGVVVHIVLGVINVLGTILVHTACGLRQRWPQLRYSPVSGRLLMGAEADLCDRINGPQTQNSLSAPAPVVVFPSANHKRGRNQHTRTQRTQSRKELTAKYANGKEAQIEQKVKDRTR